MVRLPLVVSVTDGAGRRVAGGRALAAWLARAAPSRARGAVTIGLIGDRAMRRLNLTHRRVDRATDVLSFPAGGSATRSTRRRTLAGGRGGRPNHSLGDIAIALGLARRQARDAGHSLATELRVLALHGLLHLLGYDHEVDDGRMRRVEDRLRRRAGLPTGLIARSAARVRLR
jgi:probable rRNA maturation factor